MAMHKTRRFVAFLPIVFFALFLYGVREYSLVGGTSALALAGAGAFICLAIVGTIIYRQYDPPRPCGCGRDDESSQT